MNNILSPEKNTNVLKRYHLSSKLMLPMFIGSVLLNKYNVNNNIENLAHIFTVSNFAYHSYISTSCIITDYIKPKMISTIARSSSVGLHGIALIGYYKILYKNIVN